MENSHGLVVNATVTPATAERKVALALLEAQAPTFKTSFMAVESPVRPGSSEAQTTYDSRRRWN